jgi:hypothetical protein
VAANEIGFKRADLPTRTEMEHCSPCLSSGLAAIYRVGERDGTMAMSLKLAPQALNTIEYRNESAVLLIADGEAARELARRSIDAARCRISDVATVAAAAERIDRQIALDGVVVELEGDAGEALDRLLDRLDAAARSGRYGSVVSAPRSLIDRIAARDLHAGVLHLCEADELERVMAVGRAAARHAPRLHDVGKGQGTARLQQLSEEVGRIASILAALSEEDHAAFLTEDGEGDARAKIDSTQIRTMIRARRLRDHFFRGELFADPAWDMLLDLMAARLDQQRVAVSSLCIAAAVPPTTALRWIKTLCDQGLFVRVADPEDGRRVFIELSDKAAAALDAYLRAVQRMSPLAI